jgi:hypothetical protein
MTAHTLAAQLLSRPDVPVTVAGHGALHAVTRAANEDGQPVVVLYVVAPEPPEFVLTPEAATR